MKWQGLGDDENSWVRLSDPPQSSDKLLETYHRRHLKSIHPPQFTFAREQTNQSEERLADAGISNVGKTWMSSWKPLAQTTLCSGRISRP